MSRPRTVVGVLLVFFSQFCLLEANVEMTMIFYEARNLYKLN